MKKLAIIGGGASGLAAAIAAADQLRTRNASNKKVPSSETEIVVYEADDRVGRSILATGNGRCNFSNSQVDAEKYHNASFVAEAFDALEATSADTLFDGGVPVSACNQVQAFFANIGLMWREEAQGRLYPLANKASSVLDVLRAAARDRGVIEVCEHRAVRVDLPQREGERLHIRFADGAVEHAEAVIVAVGGRAAETLLSTYVGYKASYPVLGPLRTKESLVKQLNNIRVRCAVSLCDVHGVKKAREQGELLFRNYGVSGIAVFNLSRQAQRDDILQIDFLPAFDAQACRHLLEAKLERLAEQDRTPTGEDVLRGILLPQVARVVLQTADLDPEQPFLRENLSALVSVLKGLVLTVVGIGDERQCQVRRGGVDVGEVDAQTMAILRIKGMFVTGEALDVDAPCGGYNLHWAWVSGLLAGCAAAQSLEEETSHA